MLTYIVKKNNLKKWMLQVKFFLLTELDSRFLLSPSLALPCNWSVWSCISSPKYFIFSKIQHSSGLLSMPHSDLVELLLGYSPLVVKSAGFESQNNGGWIAFCLLKLFCFDIFDQLVACENIRFSSLFTAGDVSRGGMSATQRQKFHTDDVKSVQNPVRSADWSTE